MKKVFLLTLLFLLFTTHAEAVSAETSVAESSGQFKYSEGKAEDYRVSTLRKFLKEYNSPLADYAEVFVREADKNGIDWRLVPAITGVESTFGKNIPFKSYNAYGWANGAYTFESWEDSIGIVSKSLREKYMDKGAVTINQIGRRYAPPSNTWSSKVKYFMRKIDPVLLDFDIDQS